MGQVVSTLAPVALGVLGESEKDKAQSRDARLQKEQIEQQRKTDEERRQRALRASVASQRARFGATGINVEEGSGQAVLLGLFEQSEEELNARSERDRLRSRAVDIGRDFSRSRNLLSVTNDVVDNRFSRTFLS